MKKNLPVCHVNADLFKVKRRNCLGKYGVHNLDLWHEKIYFAASQNFSGGTMKSK